jgi:hemolysin activation/secretion protein
MSQQKLLLFLLLTLLNISAALALTPQEQSLHLQQQLIQQQEQLRQQEQRRQNLRETDKIRDNRVKEGTVEDNKIESDETKQIQQCETQYKECTNNCDNSDKPNPQCLKQCSQVRIDCIKKLKEQKSCPHRFNQIILKGNTVYTTKTLHKKVLSNFINKCITKDNLQKLQTELTNFYISKGYTMARVYFDMDNIKQEETITIFPLVIDEGRIDDIKLNVVKPASSTSTSVTSTPPVTPAQAGVQARPSEKQMTRPESGRAGLDSSLRGNDTGGSGNNPQPSTLNLQQSSQILFAFPLRKRKPFNIKDFEQGLDQMNRLQSNSVTIEARPSGATGSSAIVLINNPSKTTFLNLNYSNSGNRNTGQNNLNLSISKDNLLSINDNIYLSYTESGDSLFPSNNRCSSCKNPFKNKLDLLNNDDDKLRYSKNLYAGLSFPFGYYTLSSSLNYSTYKTTNKGNYTTFNTTGETTTQSYGLDRLLHRTKTYKLNLGTTLELRDSNSYLLDLKSETGSRRTTNLNLYFNNTIYTKTGTLIIKPSYQKGFGNDLNTNLKTNPRLQYDLIKLYLYYSARFKSTMSYTLTFDSQYSFHTLYGIDQFSVGGEYTTRGFRENTIAGDDGFYVRNDVRINVYQLLNSIVKQTILTKTYLNIFHDYGCVKDKYKDSDDITYNSASGYLSGVGIGLSYYGDYLTMSLTYSKALHSPQYLWTRDGMKRKVETVYWKIGMGW